MNILSILLLIPLITALAILFAKSDIAIKIIALTGSSVQLFYASWLTIFYINYRSAGIKGSMLFEKSVEWFAPLHIYFRVGVDGISLAMVLLTSIVVVGGILVSWKIHKQVKEFFFLILFSKPWGLWFFYYN